MLLVGADIVIMIVEVTGRYALSRVWGEPSELPCIGVACTSSITATHNIPLVCNENKENLRFV